MSETEVSEEFVPRMATTLPPDVLRERLRELAPWGYEFLFSNGVRASEFRSDTFFEEEPLALWAFLRERIPEQELRGGKALDVGANVGHYSFFLRSELDMDVLGIDNDERNVAGANLLLELSGLDRVRFSCEDGNTFRIPAQFDLILHLGTLDHLQNPFLALANAAAMLKPGGWFALELQTYEHPDDERICLFVPDSDRLSCCWFLGRAALEGMLAEVGLEGWEILLEWEEPELVAERMSRILGVARKPLAEGG
jgi:SAM-dependent methyltransferase